MGRTDRLAPAHLSLAYRAQGAKGCPCVFPENRGSHPSCTYSCIRFKKKKKKEDNIYSWYLLTGTCLYNIYSWNLLISGSFRQSIGNFSIFLLTSLLVAPIGGIAVETVLQHYVRHFKLPQELALCFGQVLVPSRAWKELESWELVEGSHSTGLDTRKLIIVANAREQHKIQC